jgi:hypothetical protein
MPGCARQAGQCCGQGLAVGRVAEARKDKVVGVDPGCAGAGAVVITGKRVEETATASGATWRGCAGRHGGDVAETRDAPETQTRSAKTSEETRSGAQPRQRQGRGREGLAYRCRARGGSHDGHAGPGGSHNGGSGLGGSGLDSGARGQVRTCVLDSAVRPSAVRVWRGPLHERVRRGSGRHDVPGAAAAAASTPGAALERRRQRQRRRARD